MVQRFKPDLEVAGIGLDQILSRIDSTTGLIEFRIFHLF
jgi:hypothetical protein